MPPSRIAFAIGDLLSEIGRLLPKDATSEIHLTLDAETYSRVRRELKSYGGVVAVDGEAEAFKFAGLVICCIPAPAPADG